MLPGGAWRCRWGAPLVAVDGAVGEVEDGWGADDDEEEEGLVALNDDMNGAGGGLMTSVPATDAASAGEAGRGVEDEEWCC